MPWLRFPAMNALGGVAWASLFGTGAYLFGEKIARVAAPTALFLLAIALALVVTGIVFFRHHEKELEERAAAALPGPLR